MREREAGFMALPLMIAAGTLIVIYAALVLVGLSSSHNQSYQELGKRQEGPSRILGQELPAMTQRLDHGAPDLRGGESARAICQLLAVLPIAQQSIAEALCACVCA